MGFVRAAVFTSIVAIGGAAYVYRADVMREVGPYLGMAPAKAAETQASPAAGAQPQGRRGRANPGGAVPVVTMPVTSQAMPVVVDAVGTVQSIASVQIKPRMDSQIMKVNVEEGALVKEGDVLFELDSRALKAQLGQIEAQIRKDQAQVVQARRDLQRTEELLAKNAGTVVQRDNAGTAVKAAEAQLEADEAAKASVQTSLTFTEIRAPVSGRIGSIANKAGAVVRTGDNSAASTLATINQIDPIYVSFAIPQVILPDLRAAMAKGPVTVSAIVDDAKKQSGVMAFIENTVDPNTGTVTAKARIGNANELLWPGQFVKVEIVLGIEPDALSVPSSAVQLGSQGPFVFVIKDGVAELRQVSVKRTQDGQAVIGKGLESGEQVVVDGQLRLVQGASVTVRPPTVNPTRPTAPPRG
ncbi:efflux RND transporter periplasmic adaptor subunit [Reyranella sp. MMS21-HV4-11]|jgi:multidrug efflux system membrane fusion protein|uniref:Efflux RND transporter periplasmic adaptor subunit n=1 Tax=Reyranella humidisoli TaxID=2849149 RepID=A0ABS6IJR0_9HYPH|nr:efflux RND transporter periplasmic adaptor subunit [Reyranella sp. MMS21-HV4-11]MBU8874837.1 efflux RND transporter periplasmic adaptor subunit [Reyranella sp. MMS21-HV4-11]